ncbi:MAG: hypothetical protein ISF22_00030 [Methanomassiliicoccus sp.]|nr:hypothetical protein [Methanomassiliicoccus sp.]
MVDIKEEEGKSTGTLVIEVIIGLVSAAFAFVAALAWNEAIQTVLAMFFTNPDDPTGKLVYAVLVTIIAVMVIVGLARLLAKRHRKDKWTERSKKR